MPNIAPHGLAAGETTFSRWPRGRVNLQTRVAQHGSQCGFLKTVASFARMAIEILGDDIADLAETGGRRDADVFAQIVEAFEDPQTHPSIESLHLDGTRQCLMTAGGDGLSLIIDRVLCCCGRGKPGENHKKR